MKRIQIISLFVGAAILATIFGFITALSIKNNPGINKKLKYSCPKVENSGCMLNPGPTETKCSPDYFKWAHENCPGFKGVAL